MFWTERKTRGRLRWWQGRRERERQRWGEPCACLTEEAQGLIATCPSRGGDCQQHGAHSSHAPRIFRPLHARTSCIDSPIDSLSILDVPQLLPEAIHPPEPSTASTLSLGSHQPTWGCAP